MTRNNGKRKNKEEGKSDKKNNSGTADENSIADKSTEFFLCLACDAEAEENSIQCHDCKQWAHYKCTDLTQLQLSFLTDSPDAIQWVCPVCLKGEGEKKGALGAKIDRLTEMIGILTEKVKRLEEGCKGSSIE